MGLDVDLVKFKKTVFDANTDPGVRNVSYLDGEKHAHDLVSYRKYYEVLDVLRPLLSNLEQCDYCELTREVLEKAKVIASTGNDWEEPEHLVEFVKDLEKILAETDFDKEVVALSWIS